MSKATCDIPRTVPPSPDENLCLVAVLMSLADLLIERAAFTRQQLEVRAQEMIESPDILSTANFATAVASRIFQKQLNALLLEKAKEDASNLPPVPQYRMK